MTPPPKRPPLTPESDISATSATTLQEHLRWELWQIKLRRECSNEVLAQSLGYVNGSSASKWLGGFTIVSKQCAQRLDAAGEVPTVGGTFVALRKAYDAARQGVPASRRATATSYDVFLASPMASATGTEEYRAERQGARDVKLALENYCNFSVYYAGDHVETHEDFDPPEVAAEKNFEALTNSHRFMLLSLTPLDRPSSVHVEAGYALARKLPSLYMVPEPLRLPFVLQKLGEHRNGTVLPAVSLQYIDSTQRAVALIRRHGDELFTRLDEVGRFPARRA